MINLNLYDVVCPKINKQLTWIDTNKKLLLSREINFRQYVTISKRYNKTNNESDYFIILLDEAPQDRVYSRTKRDDYGRIKISLTGIWNETILQSIKQDCNIDIALIEHDDDGDVYQINV